MPLILLLLLSGATRRQKEPSDANRNQQEPPEATGSPSQETRESTRSHHQKRSEVIMRYPEPTIDNILIYVSKVFGHQTISCYTIFFFIREPSNIISAVAPLKMVVESKSLQLTKTSITINGF